METLNKLQISSEIAEEVKNNSEFIWFFAGKPMKRNFISFQTIKR